MQSSPLPTFCSTFCIAFVHKDKKGNQEVNFKLRKLRTSWHYHHDQDVCNSTFKLFNSKLFVLVAASPSAKLLMDVQYFTYHEATLTPEGDLDLTTIGIPVEPGRMYKYNITVCHSFHQTALFLQLLHYDPQTKGGLHAYGPLPETNTFTASDVNEALAYYPILTIVGTVSILHS
jgi:hypothetical protein